MAQSPRITYSLDFEPKALISGPPDEPGWANIDLTPSAEFAATKWIDLVGEGVLGRTVQTDDLKTTELSGRAGARFHLFSRQQRVMFNEELPKRRVVIRDLVPGNGDVFRIRIASLRRRAGASATASSSFSLSTDQTSETTGQST